MYDVAMLARIISRIKDDLNVAKDPVGYARKLGVIVGDNCRLVGIKRGQFGSEPYLIQIGNHVTIAAGTSFITHDGGVWILRSKYPDIDVFGSIRIEDNVFVGMNATLMPGVTIGHDSIVAAGSIVTRDVPPKSIVAGVPAKVIGSVDDYEKKMLAKAIHVRSLPPHEKRAAIKAHLG